MNVARAYIAFYLYRKCLYNCQFYLNVMKNEQFIVFIFCFVFVFPNFYVLEFVTNGF